MNRLFFLIPVILFACSKDKNKPVDSEMFRKIQGRMWKLDSIAFLDNGKREVSIPPPLHSQFVKFTSTQIQYYFSSNAEPPVILESDSAIYRQPNTLEAWFPGQTGGPPSYKLEVDSVTDTRLRYNFLNTPDYAKTREYYYHAY